jgi:hypothetical protein
MGKHVDSVLIMDETAVHYENVPIYITFRMFRLFKAERCKRKANAQADN